MWSKLLPLTALSTCRAFPSLPCHTLDDGCTSLEEPKGKVLAAFLRLLILASSFAPSLLGTGLTFKNALIVLDSWSGAEQTPARE